MSLPSHDRGMVEAGVLENFEKQMLLDVNVHMALSNCWVEAEGSPRIKC